MARCPNCSVENAETQRFCGDCGTPLPASSRRSAPDPAADETIPLPTDVLEPGTLFARRYQIIEELGAGGMGCVYRVLDKKIGEEIALKLIQPEVASDSRVLERFSSELKLARQVVHRNVARMFDLSEEGHVPFITMEYVRGENLKRLIRKVGRLAPGQAIPFVCQICAGLDEAHRLGIVHRDLKPQNVMIDEDGQAKILDFGLARLQTGAEAVRRPSRSGTPAYISPEQIRGLAVDARADLYSLGVILYEMLTGRTPYQADTVQELLDMHLHEPPRDPREINPGISQELSRAVLRCLEKDPANRYQSAAEMQTALDCLSDRVRPQPSAGAKRRRLIAVVVTPLAIIAIGILIRICSPPIRMNDLAVLPVKASGAEEKHQVLIEGLQSEITDKLSRVSGLRVLPRDSVNAVDLDGKSIPQIGALLGVKYLLNPEVRFEGDKIDAKIYLIEARRNSSPPPLTYVKDSPNYRLLQDEIARYTARTLDIAIAEEKLRKISRRGTDNIEAYNLYLEGMKLIEQQNDDEDRKAAIGKFEQAIAVDPAYALAYWGAGNAYENLNFSSAGEKDPDVLDKMFEYFSRASELDPTFAETNLGLGWYYFYKGDNARAFESFKKALELEPDNYIVNRDAGAFLKSIGLYEQGIRRIRRAARMAPYDILPILQIAQSWNYLGRCKEALEFAGRAVALDPGDPEAGAMHLFLLILTGRLDEADREINSLERLGARIERIPYLRELTKALMSDRNAAGVFRKELPALAPPGTYTYLLFGMKKEAIANIQAGIDKGLWFGQYLYSYPSLVKNPWYKDIRNDPRFRAILERQKGIYLRELKALEKL